MTEQEKTELRDAISASIESLLPDAGFWQNDKPLDFSFLEVLQWIEKVQPGEHYAYSMKTGFIRQVCCEYRDCNAYWKPDHLSDQDVYMLRFLHSLITHEST